MQGEDEEILLVGSTGGITYTHSGTSDDGSAIACRIRTGSFSAGRREEKLFGDIYLDVDTGGTPLSLQVFLNEETHANAVLPVASATPGRQRFLLHAFGEAPQKAHSIACEVSWSSALAGPILYQLGYAITPQPDLTNTRVTNWDDLNSPDEVWLSGITVDCDTGGAVKTINIEIDFGGVRTVIATFDVVANGRHKFKFSWLAVSAHMVRIRPDPGCAPWLLYRADWIYVQRAAAHQQVGHPLREPVGPVLHRARSLLRHASAPTKQIEVYVDEVRLTNALAGGLTYWPVVANGRQRGPPHAAVGPRPRLPLPRGG